jgi:hypothetical protein
MRVVYFGTLLRQKNSTIRIAISAYHKTATDCVIVLHWDSCLLLSFISLVKRAMFLALNQMASAWKQL